MLSYLSSIYAQWPVLSTTLLTTSAWLIIFFSNALAGWPGQKSSCFDNYLTQDSCYCESPQIGALILQPANTLSNLMFIAVALFMAYTSDSRRFPSWWATHDNLVTGCGPSEEFPDYTGYTWVPMLLCSIVSFLGPGSMMMHASWTEWGGKADVSSMLLYTGFAATFAVTKLILTIVGWTPVNIRRATSLQIFMFVILMSIIIFCYWYEKIDGILVFEVFLYMSIGIEVLIRLYERFYRKQRTAKIGLFFLGLALFGAAYGIWIPSQSGGAWCYPNSVFQGHAVWHVLCALSIGVTFFYHLSEHTITNIDMNDIREESYSVGVNGVSQSSEKDDPAATV